MSISTVSTTATTQSAATNRPDPFANVSKLLNMSSSDVRTALKSGSSLSDLASKQGVSRDDLLDAIESDLKNRPARAGGSHDGTTGASDDIAAEAAKIADTKGLPKHHGHHHHGGASGVGGSGLTPATTDASMVSSQLSSGGAVDVLL